MPSPTRRALNRGSFLALCCLFLIAASWAARADDIVYIYDSQNRLIEVRYPDRTIKYTYDAAGNRVTVTVEVPSPTPTPTPSPTPTPTPTPAATSISAVSGGGVYNGTIAVMATLSSSGAPVPNKVIDFSVNGSTACNGGGQPICPTTDSSGIASLNLSGLNADTYPVTASFAGDASFAASSNNGTLSVSKASATITLGNLTHTYDGSPKAASGATNPPGLATISITYSQSGVPVASPTSAGAYDVVATLSNSNYQASNAAGTLSISQANSTTTVSVTNATYDGSPHGGSATVTGAGGLNQSLTVSYSGRNGTSYSSTTAPTSAGDYTASASFSDANHSSSSDNKDFQISKATATITLGNLSQTYDGSAKSATATTNPNGKNVVLSYSQSGQSVTSPINAGGYDVSATVDDANYQGSTTGTLVIGKATATITLGNLAQTYDGGVKSATATTNPTGKSVLFSYTQNGQPTAFPINAGSYDVSATISDANYQGSTTGTLVIGKGTATITLGGLTQTYDGSAKNAIATTNPPGLSGVAISYMQTGVPVATPINAGSYDVPATLTNNNYQASDATATLTISKASSMTTVSVSNATYDGSPHAGTATVTGAGGLNQSVIINYSGRNGTSYSSKTAPTNAGDYTASASFSDANHSSSSDSRDFQIAKATATVTLGNLTQTYNGNPTTATATTNPSGKTVVFSYSQNGQSVASPTNAGTYDVSATITDPNSQGATIGTLVISKATATITLGNLAQTYDGNAKTATATTNPTGKSVVFSYSQNGQAVASPTNAGSYDVSATISDANYQGSAAGTLVIGKATVTITLGDLTQTYDGSVKRVTATTNPPSLNGVSVSYTQSGAPVTSPTAVGTYDVLATLNNSNYQATNATGTLVINQGTATITLGNLTQFYDGTAKSATVSTTPSGLPVTISYTQNGAVSSPTALGAYDVSATINDPNYLGSATGTLTIAPQLLTYEGNRALALDSVTYIRDPFPLTALHNFSSDQRTRILIFTRNLGLTPSDTSSLSVKAGNVPLNIELVGTLSDAPDISFIIVKLDGLIPGDVFLTFTFHGVASNAGVISISP